MIPQELTTKLVELLEGGDVQALAEFVKAHIDEFPEEEKRAFVLSLFQNMLQMETERIEDITAVREELLEELGFLDSLDEEITNQRKVEELKATLSPENGQN